MDYNSLNRLNDFMQNFIKENILQKNKYLLEIKENNEILARIKSKIIHLEKNLCYDDNIFDPSNLLNKNEKEMQELNNKKEILINKNKDIQNSISLIEKKINEINEINSKMKVDSNKDFIQSSKELEKYKIEILRSQELERKRIARDLHDTVIQNLTNLIHKTEFTLKIMDVDNIRAKLELMTMSNCVKDIIDEMRGIIYNLRPMALDDIGIDVIIERELTKMQDKGIIVKYEIEGNSNNVDQILLLTIIRIIQEACNNTIKHANATEVKVKIIYNDKFIEFYFIDNGIGFDISNNMCVCYESKSGFGLPMMRERISLLSGIINFKSIINKGTEIYVKIPRCIRENMNEKN
ncbi:MAG: sensor histidine kinase [Lachnotalea sp.]